jgi:hypothetical protein
MVNEAPAEPDQVRVRFSIFRLWGATALAFLAVGVWNAVLLSVTGWDEELEKDYPDGGVVAFFSLSTIALFVVFSIVTYRWLKRRARDRMLRRRAA